MQNSGKNKNMVMGSLRGPNPRTTVLEKASSNLLDWTDSREYCPDIHREGMSHENF
jgi:hypothetical protein